MPSAALSESLKRLRAQRDQTLARFAGMTPLELQAPVPWRGQAANLYHRLAWLSEGDDRRVAMLGEEMDRQGVRLSAAQRAAVRLAETRGRLYGALVGLSDPSYDLAPGEGEWPVRQTLGHIIANDLRYIIAIRHAVARTAAGGTVPLRPPASELPESHGAPYSGGTVAELHSRLYETRDTVMDTIVTISDGALDAPTVWVAWELDVRFRINRFAAHDREHTIQVLTSVQALGLLQTDARLVLGNAMAVRGALEGTTVASAATRTPGLEPSILRVLEEAFEDERELLTLTA